LARILIVDDERNIRLFMAENLKVRGYDVMEARDGVEALHALQSEHIALVITDLVMPNMDGLELITRLKQDYADIPIVVVSASAEISSLNCARELSVDAVLTKPFAPQKLLQITQTVLNVRTD
jgi:CheY-like chemotaxis protein